MSIEPTSKVIGFASQYYTLWNMFESKHYSKVNGKDIHTGTTWNYNYIQNLSKSEDQAIQKVAKRFRIDQKNIIIDEGLRGVCTRSFTKYIKICMPYSVFCQGKVKWESIEQSEDVWQLKQVYSGDRAQGGSEEFSTLIPLKRRAIARRKLIELGELIRLDHLIDRWDDKWDVWIKDKCQKYISKSDYTQQKKAKESFFLHEDKEKLELTIREVKRVGYDSAYGYVSVVTYENEIGHNYIYKGSNPLCVEESGFFTVKATIKHSEYKEVKQTLIQRVKLISK